MKVAFIGQKGMPAVGGGVERYVEDLSIRLAEAGNEVTVYTRAYYTPAALREYSGVKLVSLPSIYTKHLDAITHSFLACMHAIFSGAEIIHFQSIGSALVSPIPRIFNPKIRIVSTLQSRDYEHGKWGRLAKRVLLLGEWLMCKMSDSIVVVTQSMVEYVRERYGKEAIYIPNGAVIQPEVGSESLATWNLESKKYIVAISRFISHKGLSHLVEAYKQLPELKQPLVLVGEGSFTDEYVSELKKLASTDKRIIFTGPQYGETLAELYANAYLFVQPSESEGLSLALLEAMARRVPVLVSDIPENLEAVGQSALVFATRDVEDLREKLRFAVENPEILEEKITLALRRVDICFNWDQIAQNMNELYAQNLNEVKPSEVLS
ncbi:hypothetical protein COT94_01370 [Candidatus Falkowbacteria bacterium CG10_big_fil_rev_8_21_14_0_10_37_14]|uniref:Glycosyl transferase family 1 n=1 Tax=Candidatus Falkowbacteria bacterium CG10_big_fil_rev_8_21_14_0_10_37_14 TaxID=1974561 RepID=A0A2M6WU57_9BACT|nr:glycosyltransferase family 4 protein [Candidatus Falkowbacteria bacterium]PIT96325.1 MAG: hypothetical protein COT94_01370 [Candidatus Falkowbacteria bacterium CG10_big_fil_rev_8_21_14_0_10_37_14]